jgi:hypothetical protein
MALVPRQIGATLVGVVALATLCLAAPAAAAPHATAISHEQSLCTRNAGAYSPGNSVKPPITLTPDLPAQTVNFGGGRGWKYVDVVLRASQPLPTGFEISQLDLEVLRHLVSQGDTTTTVASGPITFTEPRLNPRRDVITFTICLNGAGLSAGHYAGAITAEGPDGIGPANLTINANAKDGRLFWITLALSGILVFVLLVWRGATGKQSDVTKQVAAAVSNAPVAGGNITGLTEDLKTTASKSVGDKARWNLKRDVLTDPFFLLSTIISAAFAIAAAFTIYSQNTAWGSDPAVDAFAVASAVLAAAGFRSLLASGAGK